MGLQKLDNNKVYDEDYSERWNNSLSYQWKQELSCSRINAGKPTFVC